MSSRKRRRRSLGRVAAALLERAGILADDATSTRLSAVDDELAAIDRYRRRHQAHPMGRTLDPEYDELADAIWGGVPIA